MLPRLYVIADTEAAHAGCGDVVRACQAAADAGAQLFQVRHKTATAAAQFDLAERLTRALAGYNVTLLVNDRADIALSLGCDGVHRPQSGIPVRAVRRVLEQRLIATSCHTAAELLTADAEGADFVTFGPVFETASKPGARLAGIDGVSAASKLVGTPLFALGGVTPDHVASCLRAGAYGIAVLSGIMAARDPYAATAHYLETIQTVTP